MSLQLERLKTIDSELVVPSDTDQKRKSPKPKPVLEAYSVWDNQNQETGLGSTGNKSNFNALFAQDNTLSGNKSINNNLQGKQTSPYRKSLQDEKADWYSLDSNKEWGEMISGLEISDARGSGQQSHSDPDGEMILPKAMDIDSFYDDPPPMTINIYKENSGGPQLIEEDLTPDKDFLSQKSDSYR